MAEMHRAVGKAAGARELDVVGAQHLEHLGAHQAHDQRELVEAERDRRHHQRLQPRRAQQPGGPPPQIHHLAAAEGGQHLELDREHVDQQDADQEGGQRHAHQRQPHDRVAQPAVAAQRGIHAERDPERERAEARDQRQLQRGRQALGDHIRHRPRHAVGNAELALRRVGHEAQELQRHRIVQAKRFAQRLALGHRRFLPDHVVHRVADVAEQAERDQRHRQHDEDGLQQAAQDEGGHEGARSRKRGVRCGLCAAGRPRTTVTSCTSTA